MHVHKTSLRSSPGNHVPAAGHVASTGLLFLCPCTCSGMSSPSMMIPSERAMSRTLCLPSPDLSMMRHRLVITSRCSEMTCRRPRTPPKFRTYHLHLLLLQWHGFHNGGALMHARPCPCMLDNSLNQCPALRRGATLNRQAPPTWSLTAIWNLSSWTRRACRCHHVPASALLSTPLSQHPLVPGMPAS
jgi:hypothetical protein